MPATGSSAVVPEQLNQRDREHLALTVLIAVLAMVMVLVRRDGHWWGDDWALYVRQAQALFSGGVDQVVADNEFTVQVTGRPEFSPPMYPWGYPILLAPFVALLGSDLDRLAISQVIFMSWFLVMWHRLARPRMGASASLLGVAILGLSPQYLRWTEFIQSELAFMAVTATALVVLDRSTTRQALVDLSARMLPLMALGFAAGAAFSVRREGLAVVAAIAVAQILALRRWWQAENRSPVPTGRIALRLLVPHTVAALTVGILQILLPATTVPRYEGNGIHNVWAHASDHLGHVMAQIGLRNVWSDAPTVLGSTALGSAAVALFTLATVAGLVWAALRRPDRDLPVIAFLVAVLMIGGSFRVPGSRYVAAVGPIALIFVIAAVSPLAAAAGRHQRKLATTAVALLALLALGNAVRATQLAVEARQFNRSGQVQWGPTSPDAVQMFAAVDRLTTADAVVGFFKARAMTQRTDRRAVQVDQWRPLERTIGSISHLVIQRGDPIGVAIVQDPDGFELLWANPSFALHRVRDEN
jgi:4-amino-4-deoxy-L-arabinose transferase-like glycosyltransferase